MTQNLEPYDIYAPNDMIFNESLGTGKKLPKSRVHEKFIREFSVPTRHCISAKAMRKLKHGKDSDTTGKLWYDMPAKEVTEETKLDLLALQYGRQIHPSTFYKQPDSKGLPRYFQIGRMVDKPGNLESTASKRKKSPVKSFLNQLSEDEKLHKYLKKSYHEHKQREKRKKEALRRRFRPSKKHQ
ncbi:hypothetical protein GJ496_005761 [Pomphorhynchus laevis]|nr:hypothetical protein GJ496_005761 [Pomphorhynchus laevis]